MKIPKFNLKDIGTFVLFCLLISLAFIKLPTRKYTIQKEGVTICNIIAANETYYFTNISKTVKVITGLHFIPMSMEEPKPQFKIVLQPGQVDSFVCAKGLIDQIVINGLDCTNAELKPLAYVNAARLRNGRN